MPPDPPTIAFSNEVLDGQEEAVALSLEDPNYFSVESHASTSGSYNNTSTVEKRPLSDDEQQRKRKKYLHNQALAENLRQLQDDVKKNAELSMKYAGGALRITRTPGRQNTPNTVSLDDLIHPNYLSSALVYSFFIENEHLFQYFPFKTSPNPRPYVKVYIGRDLAQDMVGKQLAGLYADRPKRADYAAVVENAQAAYREEYGENFHAFYAPYMGSGCAHSKIMVLIYPDFLRVVITSANLMQMDVVDGDNMWFIQDFPRRLSKDSEYVETDFEQHLRRHVEQLGCPEDFRSMYLTPGVFDFSAVKVHLVTSKPGNLSKADATEYGQLRLRHVVREILNSYTDANLPKTSFEICVGSVGHLENKGVVKDFLESCAGNRQKSIEGKPALKIIFPTRDDVKNSKHGVPGARNISCHIDWKSLASKSAEYLQQVFYHYHSKDARHLFHLKSILALRADAPTETPLYMYMGSANFSAGAWGTVVPERRKNVIAMGVTTRLESVQNYECGVVVEGCDIVGMLETGKWEDVVPYVRPTEDDRYEEGERPFQLSYSDLQGPPLVLFDRVRYDGGSENTSFYSVMDLVRVLSDAAVLHLICKA
ncbi:tyrosyl-DNA phosphodiesterase-domain-containing protein [Mycena leptocephala]|nr:tyrosyl-DNA phosphodiesterase-domain-containing protein [Mycena leptocephala]